MLSNSFKWKHFVGEIILLNVRWCSFVDDGLLLTEVGVCECGSIASIMPTIP
jgi:hypothetical protein